MKKYYLAYGSNLNSSVMKSHCPTSKKIGKTIISNYALVFKGQENNGYLTIEPKEHSIIPLGIYEINDFDEKKLDEYEGVPTLYSKKDVIIMLNGEPANAIIYIMNEAYSYTLPRFEYLKLCMTGYEEFGFNKDILSQALLNSLNNESKKLIK